MAQRTVEPIASVTFDIDNIAAELRRIANQRMTVERREEVAEALVAALLALTPDDEEGFVSVGRAEHYWQVLRGANIGGEDRFYIAKGEEAEPTMYASEAAARAALPAMLRGETSGFAVVWERSFDNIHDVTEIARLTPGAAGNPLVLVPR